MGIVSVRQAFGDRAGGPEVEEQVRTKVLGQRKEQLYQEWLTELKNVAKIQRTPLAATF